MHGAAPGQTKTFVDWRNFPGLLTHTAAHHFEIKDYFKDGIGERVMTQTTISQEEIARLERARAVARRQALREAAQLCDLHAAALSRGNPGRKRGTVSQTGKTMSGIATDCGNKIWALRSAIEI
jgi:hypothetical protein